MFWIIIINYLQIKMLILQLLTILGMCANYNHGVQMKIIFVNDNCQPQMLINTLANDNYQNKIEVITI